MNRRSSKVSKSHFAVFLFISVIIFISASLALAADSSPTTIPVPTPADDVAWLRTGGQVSEGVRLFARASDIEVLPNLNAASSQSLTLTPIADSDVIENFPDLNTGNSTELWAGYDDRPDPQGGIMRGLMKFDISSIPANAIVTSAKLRLAHVTSYGYEDQSLTITTHRITADWTELGVKWNNMPGYAGSYGSQSILHSDWSAFEFDMTDLVADWYKNTYTNYGIMIRGPETADTGFRGFASRETGMKPELIIEYDRLPGCYEGLVNGGFEERTAWTLTSTQYTAGYAEDPEPVRSGEWSMRTGIVNPDHNKFSYSSAIQTVTLPDDADYITLKVWILPQSGEPESIPLRLPKNPLTIEAADAATVSDWQFLFILDQYGGELERLLYRRQDVDDLDDWQYHSFDLSHYANRTIKIYFDTFNNGYDGITSMHIDDVSLQICTGTPPPEPDGTIEGTVTLQSRTDNSGAEVCADDGGTPVCQQTDAAGVFSIEVPEGSYKVTVDKLLYLDAEKLNVPVTSSNTTSLDPVTLLGGDTNDDCAINILDLSLVGSRFGLSCGGLNWDGRADINDDCTVNILDLTAIGGNFGDACPVSWS